MRPDTAMAEALFGEALAAAGKFGMRPLEAQCRLGLGGLLHRAGRLAEARAETRAAVTLFEAMDLTPGLEQARRQLEVL
jgi:Flp pilus assembly protein TadD